jgi:rhodanese-related sulfurtransferase
MKKTFAKFLSPVSPFFKGGSRGILILALLLTTTLDSGAQQTPAKISPRELQSLVQKNEATPVNIMSRLECADHQVRGSLCIPCDEFSQKGPGLLKTPPLLIVVYGDSAADAANCPGLTASTLPGFQLSVLEGGLENWKKAGFETVSIGRVPRVPIASISIRSLKGLAAQGKQPLLVDIRPERLFREEHIEGAVNIPLDSLPARYYEIPFRGRVVLVDEDGRASFLAGSYLKSRGYTDVGRLRGGMAAWNRESAKEKK